LQRGDWQLTLLTATFVVLNVYLWTLQLSQERLFAITTPMGVAYFLVLIWLLRRS
jgi:uncharacterized membrane protein YozB (DUF420 family)